MEFFDDKSRRIELPKEKIENLIKVHREEYFKKAELEKKRKEEAEKKEYLEKKWIREIERVKNLEKKYAEKEKTKEKRKKQIFSLLHSLGLVKTNEELSKINNQKKVSMYLKNLKKSKTGDIL